jgi:hypothetical protein
LEEASRACRRKSRVDTYATVATDWITAGAAVAALLGAAGTILQSRRIARRTQTYSYIARLTTPEFYKVLVDSTHFLACREVPPGWTPEAWANLDARSKQEEQWKRWEALGRSNLKIDREKFMSIVALPNQLEDVAGMYNHNLLDRAIVKTHVEAFAESFWRSANWWVEAMRQRDPMRNTYQDLALMLHDLRRRKRPRWHYPRNGRIKRDFIR